MCCDMSQSHHISSASKSSPVGVIEVPLSTTTMLKGLAILAVVLTHILSSLPGRIFTTDAWQPFYVGLDQTLRFCVPLFVAISGFSLSKKYQSSALRVASFLRRRFSKLLPLYLLWSLVFLGLFWAIPAWRRPENSPSLLNLLALGRSDYHLYFVPMIFQLYVIFPVIFSLFQDKKRRFITLLTAFVIQISFFLVVHYLMQLAQKGTVTEWKWLTTDYGQYVLSFSWLGYFALGVWLGWEDAWLKHKKWLFFILFGVLAVSWWRMVHGAVIGIQAGGDPLYELRFTRLIVLVYASCAITVTLVFHRLLRYLPRFTHQVLLQLGRHSYLIYLVHTLFLRVIFSEHLRAKGEISWGELVFATGVGVVTILVSLKMGKE